MTQYISKSALVAEIARQKAQWRICKSSEAKYRREMLDDISSFIDTLEVKEIDLKEEVERFAKASGYKFAATIDFQFAEHFFALGMAVSNKA